MLATLLLFVVGLLLLVGGAEWLVRGASRLAAAAGLSPLVIGLTLVAFGTSTPELAVSVGASIAGRTELAVANVVGSNIANVLLILGLCAILRSLVVAQALVWFEVPLAIAASLLVLVMGFDGRISRLEGGVLVACLVAYTAWTVLRSRGEEAAIEEEYSRAVLGGTIPGTRSAVQLARDGAMVLAGLGLLVLGARWVVDGATRAATVFGVSDAVIGLTVVAVGTSLPEVATSIVATLRGERDIAVGNVVGSNLFNIFGVAGFSALFGASDLLVGHGLLWLDVPVMIASAVACLPIFWTGHSIDRWEGALFLGLYAAYLSYLVLRASEHDALAHFNLVVAWFVLPLAAATLAVGVVRQWRRNRSAA